MTFIKQNKYRILLGLIYLLGFLSIGLVFTDVSAWWLLAGLLWSKIVQLIGHSIGMHRYFTHKTFKTTVLKEKIMGWTSILLGVGSPIAYARNHRQHHKVADTEEDVHSPHNQNKIIAILGLWEFRSLKYFMSKGGSSPRDLITNPSIRFIHDHYYKIWIILTVLTLAIDWKITLYLLYLPAFIYHMELGIFVNYIGHTFGYKNFDTTDKAGNNKWVHLWTLGEGLHNNHHAKPWLYNWKVKDDEPIDISAWAIDKFFIKNIE